MTDMQTKAVENVPAIDFNDITSGSTRRND